MHIGMLQSEAILAAVQSESFGIKCIKTLLSGFLHYLEIPTLQENLGSVKSIHEAWENSVFPYLCLPYLPLLVHARFVFSLSPMAALRISSGIDLSGHHIFASLQ